MSRTYRSAQTNQYIPDNASEMEAVIVEAIASSHEAMNHPDPTAETLPNVQEPNPYRTTVMVEQDSDLIWWVYIDHILRHGANNYVYVAEFPTKEEADTHAALILAALHQAVME